MEHGAFGTPPNGIPGNEASVFTAVIKTAHNNGRQWEKFKQI